MRDVLELAWPDVERDVEALAAAVRRAAPPGGFDRLVAVARGALAPAALLCARLGIERVETVQVRAYEDRRALSRPTLLGAAPEAAGPSGDASRTLVLDELLDSGRTLAAVGALLPRATCAVLLVKGDLAPGSAAPPGLVRCAAPAHGPAGVSLLAARVVPASRWVVFPWTPPSER